MSNIPVPNIQKGIQQYVADVTLHQSLDATLTGFVRLEAIPADDTTLSAAASNSITLAAGGENVYDPPLVADTNFGRTVHIEMGTPSVAGTLTVTGRDYLGQVVVEDIAHAAADVDSVKAFKFIDKVAQTGGTTVEELIFKTGSKVGLPFVVSDVLEEYADGVPASAPVHVAADLATPTASTGDVRGTVDPTTALDGSVDIDLVCRFNNAATGGLYGQVQYNG